MRDTPARNPQYELSLLKDAEEIALIAYGEQSNRFTRTVLERLALGAEEYGDDAFLEKDNLLEALYEPPDSAAYAILDLQRLLPSLSEDDREELRVLTVGAMAAAINLDVALRRLLQARQDLTGS